MRTDLQQAIFDLRKAEIRLALAKERILTDEEAESLSAMIAAAVETITTAVRRARDALD